ncbi:metalloregulator ArsR/SmtB family transcription factor [Lysobacter maris]|uniref:Metalloregulator ArsR/SmtB family transcription factor n=1 Tax=Marilutibacter maris TaxID=1605891 RepID=A0A508A3E2_9GAMM|nr:metalloregulator ArsR/SmtB family transcription factor [Lysobacter maris]KAB8162817.1 metalloregulator ArsR/SmtB family transcription factor [Lysobacter maris]
MVNDNSPQLDALFQALSDPTRRSMLQALARQPLKVGELAAPFRMSLAAASKHIKVLEGAGLIRREVEGRTHTCHLKAAPMHAGLEWIRHYERFWNSRLDALEALLEADDAAPSIAPPTPTPPASPKRRKRKNKE